MRLTKPIAAMAALTFFILVAHCGETFAQDSNAKIIRVASGQKLKIQGIVIKRRADSFRVRDTKMVETDVRLTDSTKVRTHHNGVFRGGTTYAASNILRGLRLQVVGVGDANGQLVAGLVKFDERDLRTAQALQATVDPIQELAESNPGTNHHYRKERGEDGGTNRREYRACKCCTVERHQGADYGRFSFEVGHSGK